ncbi:hypothetical protein [Zooshikella ganghwensis]|uniref:hypothetical protein n=1 Tax=Zooshikella ganghwensis TaxID=202772 RepID=UPI000426DF4E|nr:hypothetical protein [Zooshikella ganghwensis]
MEGIVVTNKSELEKAKEKGEELIVVKGDLANNLKKSKKIALAGTTSIAGLTVALAAAPFTGGLSSFAAVPVTVLTGLEIAAVIAATSVGLVLLIAVFKDYEEISYKNGELTLRRKSK